MEAFTVFEAARILKTHPNQLRKWIKDGKVKAFRLGTAVRITDSELRRVMGLEETPHPRLRQAGLR